MMRFNASILVVENVARSRAFYTELLGCTVTLDLGENVTFNNAFSIQDRAWWTNAIHKTQADIRYGGNDIELYFEEGDFDAFLEKLSARTETEYLVPVHEMPWGQRSVQFFDPDHHIIEVGEHMGAVVRRHLANGMTISEVAKHMDIPESYAAQQRDEYLA